MHRQFQSSHRAVISVTDRETIATCCEIIETYCEQWGRPRRLDQFSCYPLCVLSRGCAEIKLDGKSVFLHHLWLKDSGGRLKIKEKEK